MARSCIRTERPRARTWIALLAVIGALLLAPAMARSAENVKLTPPELMRKFAQAPAVEQMELLPRIFQPDSKDDIAHYKIPEFLIKVLKDDNADPRVRHIALDGMVHLIEAVDISYQTQFVPALSDVLSSEATSSLVQEYVLLAAPTVVDPTSPGPSKVLLERIRDIAKDEKRVSDTQLRLREQAVIALGKIASSDDLSLFFKLLTDRSKPIIASAVEAMYEYLKSPAGQTIELTGQQVGDLVNLLKNPATSYDEIAAILRVLGVNARNFRLNNKTNTPRGSIDCMEKIRDLLLKPQPTPVPYFVVGACIETLGDLAQKEAVPLIRLILQQKFMFTADALQYRKQSVDVLNDVIAVNIGDGKSANQVVVETIKLLEELLNDPKEDGQVRVAAAFDLADVRYPCYNRGDILATLSAYAFKQDGITVDPALMGTAFQSIEVIAGRTFPKDWTGADFADWFNKVGKTEMAPH
ncbi:MAG: hypothetical protein ACREJ2_05945 [Planctomycetota bacterium]